MTLTSMKKAALRFALVPALLALPAACRRGVDDPANIPKLGSWEDVTTVDSVTLDGRSIPEEMLPENARAMLAKMRKTDQKCGEPAMRDQAAMEALMTERLDYQCRFDSYGLKGAMFSGIAHCNARDVAGFEAEPTIKIDGTVDPERVKLNIQSIVRLKEKTGASNLLVISARRTFRRLGDC